jgi:high-affinity K+ transport system ATPase subunit B
MDDNNVEKYKTTGTNDELLSKLDRMIEMFEEQKEIKTTQKNEEIILYSFLGVFTIYILDTFVSIGKYTR